MIQYAQPRAGVGFIDPVTATLIVGGAQTGISLLLGRQGAERRRKSTLVVDEAERLMVANLEAFDRGERTRYEALAEFDSLWSQLVAGCAQVGGDPGQRCVSERTAGGVYDYFARYRAPIEQAPDPAPVTYGGSGGAATIAGGGSGGFPLALLGAGLLVVALMAGGDE